MFGLVALLAGCFNGETEQASGEFDVLDAAENRGGTRYQINDSSVVLQVYGEGVSFAAPGFSIVYTPYFLHDIKDYRQSSTFNSSYEGFAPNVLSIKEYHFSYTSPEAGALNCVSATSHPITMLDAFKYSSDVFSTSCKNTRGEKVAFSGLQDPAAQIQTALIGEDI